jgi:hypothetical protein
MITAAICNSWKQEILSGTHLSAHSYKIALFTSSATLNKSTTTYTGQANEVANGSGYTTGGATLAGFATSLDTDTAILTFTTPLQWSTASFTARGALIYNDTLAGKNSVAVLDFGQDYTATNGTFSINLPAASAAAALIRIN